MERHDYFDDRAEDMGLDPDEAWQDCLETVEEMEREGIETDWVSASDCLTAHKLRDQDERTGYYTDYMPRDGTDRTLTVPDEETAALWMGEMVGQISDGKWENHRWSGRDGYQLYTDARVEVDPGSVPQLETNGRMASQEDKLDFEDIEYEEMRGRMIFHVRHSGVDSHYDENQLDEDLHNLNQMRFAR